MIGISIHVGSISTSWPCHTLFLRTILLTNDMLRIPLLCVLTSLCIILQRTNLFNLSFRTIIYNPWFFLRSFLAVSFLPTSISSPSLARINAFFWPSSSMLLLIFDFSGALILPPISDLPSLSTALLRWIVYHKRHFIKTQQIWSKSWIALGSSYASFLFGWYSTNSLNVCNDLVSRFLLQILPCY